MRRNNGKSVKKKEEKMVILQYFLQVNLENALLNFYF